MTDAPKPGPRSLAPRLRRLVRGFTLIELTVSLVAGLIVAMSVAVLSHEATASFNEEIRISAAEASLRGAADRLRSDLQRASFMTTPNIQADPLIGKVFGQVGNVPSAPPGMMASLQGVYFVSNSNNATNGLTLDTVNGVSPSTIQITGNLSSAEQFEVENFIVQGSCCRINLVTSSPAIFRVLNANDAGAPDPNADTEMQYIFAPAPPTAGSSNAYTSAQFWVRYVDTVSNHAQFLPTCPNAGAQIAGLKAAAGTNVIQPYVLTATCPLTAAQTKLTGSDGVSGGLALVNPVQTVQWEIVGTTSKGTQLPPQDLAILDTQPSDGGTDPNKYDLVRSLVDYTGKVIPETTEIVAEYAVDLEFGFSVDIDHSSNGNTPQLVAYDFGDTNGQAVAGAVNVPVPATPGNPPDPQRIRSIRFMISTRAAIPDRPSALPVQTVADAGGGTFMYRYCMTATGCSGNTLMQWARVRTVVGEVALVNQQQAFY